LGFFGENLIQNLLERWVNLVNQKLQKLKSNETCAEDILHFANKTKLFRIFFKNNTTIMEIEQHSLVDPRTQFELTKQKKLTNLTGTLPTPNPNRLPGQYHKISHSEKLEGLSRLCTNFPRPTFTKIQPKTTTDMMTFKSSNEAKYKAINQ
jgi:hypothetical protein